MNTKMMQPSIQPSDNAVGVGESSWSDVDLNGNVYDEVGVFSPVITSNLIDNNNNNNNNNNKFKRHHISSPFKGVTHIT